MILHYVADGPGLIIESGATLDAEVFGHGDLDAFHIVAVPERFQQRVGEAEEQHVMHGLFAEVMVDPKNALFVESTEQNLVELLRGDEVSAERLFDNDASALAGTAGFAELL